MIQNRIVRGVLLDVDGTLIDSNDAHAHAWLEAMGENGYKDVPFEKVRPLIGMGGDKVLPEVIGVDKDSDDGKKISQSRKEIFKTRYIPTLHAFPYTLDLLKRMHGQGLKLIIATSAEPDELDAVLQLIDPHASELFADQSSSEDAKVSKPDSDVVQVAIKKADLSPQELVMLGDTAYDIEAADKADVKTIAFRSGGWKDEDLKGAVAIYNDPADLLARYNESPLVKGLSQ
jgi:phosphoglycolate phosphatase-like HAD superfamily hydrolase